VASTDGDSVVQADVVMPLAKACLGSEMNCAQRAWFSLVCMEMSAHTGKARINQTMQGLDVFFCRSLKMNSTNILIHMVNENLMFVVLRLKRGGVSSSKLVL